MEGKEENAMKKSFKKLASLGLAAAMVVSLVGCGTKDDGTTPGSDGNESGGTTNESGAATFKIGAIGPLTGEAASYGISVKNGAEIAIKEINDAGGVTVGDKKYILEMNFADDQASPDIAVSAFNTVMDWGAQAILGSVTSGSCLAITKDTFEAGILQITPSGSAQGCTEYENAFRLCFTDPLQGVTMANLAKELGYEKIAIIYNNSDEYSTGIMNAFTDQVAENGGTIVATEAFGKGAIDFNTQLTKIKATDAEVIFVPAYYNDAAYITQQASDLGMNLPFLGSDGWDGVLAQVKDPAVLEGAIFLSPFFANDEAPAIKKFVETYQTKYGAVPDQFAADGYDTVYVMKAALEKASSVESKDLISAMTQITVDGLTGSVSFTADGEPNKGAKYIEIKDGNYTARQ